MCRILLLDDSYILSKIKDYSSCKEYIIDELKDISCYNKVIKFKPNLVFINKFLSVWNLKIKIT